MGMGAIAGLVLFIYGVTRLAEGLEDVGEERMKRPLANLQPIDLQALQLERSQQRF